MKKVTKIMLVIAGITLVSGLLMLSITYALVGGNLSKLSTGEDFEKKEYEVSESEIDNLEIDLHSNAIEIVGTDTDKIHITYYENDTQKYEITESDKTLKLRQIPIHKISFFVLNFDFEAYSVKIEMPEELVGHLEIDNLSGSVKLDDLSVGEDLSINIASGSLKTNHISCSQNAIVLASSGSVKMYDSIVSEDAKLDLSSGSLTIQNFEAGNFDANVSSGSAHLTNVKVNQVLRCNGSSGTIQFDQMDSNDKIIISAASGSIRGSIVGKMSDYTIHSKVSSGSCNLPEFMEGGSKQLDVNAQSGSIKIEFSEME